jgi:hypothetical protein
MRAAAGVGVIAWLAAAAYGADAATPVAAGEAERRAFDDLAMLYGGGRVDAFVDRAFAELTRANPDRRAAAGRYLRALLAQAQSDETNGRAEWRRIPAFGGGAESAARYFRTALAARVADGPPVPELADAAVWLVREDDLVKNAAAGSRLLARLTEPGMVDVYRRVLSPAHPVGDVLTTLLGEVGRRRLVALRPEVLALSDDPRSAVRAAAAAAARALGGGDLPPFDADKALAVVGEPLLRDVSARSLTAVPKDAAWKRFTVRRETVRPGRPDHYEFSGWLLGAAGDDYEALDYFGEKVRLPKARTVVTERALADDVRAVLAARAAPAEDGRDRGRESLSPMGGYSAQFEPSFTSLPELLLAAWSLERGDRSSAAALILPCFDRAADRRWVEEAARDLQAGVYHQALLSVFTGKRDYAEALRIARHLSKPQFAGWVYFDRTRELAAQLEGRSGDFQTLTLPTPDDWQRLRAALPRPAQIAHLAERMRLLNCFQKSQPGDVDFDGAQTREPAAAVEAGTPGTPVINPFVELRGMALEAADLPALLPSLDDENFVPSYGYWRTFHPDRSLYRVNQFIGWLINDVAGRELVDQAAYQAADGASRWAMREAAAAWIRANAGRTRVQLLTATLQESKDAADVRAAARELARRHEIAALPALLAKVREATEDDARAEFAACCFRLDPAGSLADARRWVTMGGRLRFWGALVLFVAGDRARGEGVAPLAAALAADDDAIDLYREAFGTLLRSDRPAGPALAAGVLRRLPPGAGPYDTDAFVHRLLLAGRREAVDYLCAWLDDDTAAGQTQGAVGDKVVTVAATRGDGAGELIAGLRTDGYAYPAIGTAAERRAERARLKTWLAGQMALIRAGKPSAVAPVPPEMGARSARFDTPP